MATTKKFKRGILNSLLQRRSTITTSDSLEVDFHITLVLLKSIRSGRKLGQGHCNRQTVKRLVGDEYPGAGIYIIPDRPIITVDPLILVS